MSRIVTRILGTGSYLPANCVTNEKLAETVDTTDEWIRTRTGIRTRYIAAEDELTSDIGVQAARQAMDLSLIHI